MKSMMRKNYNLWKKSYQSRKNYSTTNPHLFFKIAAKYLPPNEKAIIVDIGAGNGKFEDYLKLVNKYKNLFLLDGNSETIENLKGRYKNAIPYRVPDKLPFESATVSYVICSHLIEHLYYQEFYKFLKEIDRILDKDGILVIISPLLWSTFYSDLSHVKPYNPDVFLRYLCQKTENRSHVAISQEYSILELIYRYTNIDINEGWGSSSFIIDFLIQLLKKVLYKLRIQKYAKNGYLLVLKKNQN